MIGLINRLRRNERGNVLIITAMAAPLLIGMAGFSVDTIQWALWKRQLQRAADSAAIAGVYERNAVADATQAQVAAAVAKDLTLNQHVGTLDAAAAVTLPADQWAPDKRVNQVRVSLAYTEELMFSSFFGRTPTIRVTSQAASVPGAGEYCVIALDPRNGTGITIAGSTTVDLGDCCMIANASSPTTAFDHNGKGSTVIAGCIAAVGGVDASDSTRWDIDNYFPYSDPAVDPFADLPMKERDDCEIFYSFDKNADDVDLTGIGHEGKVVCIEEEVTIKNSLKLAAATYVISSSGDALKMSSAGSALRCDGCTILATNFDDPADTGNLKLTGGTIDLKAPTGKDETYRGIALFQDRRAADDTKDDKANHINGGNLTSIQGVMYMPNRSLFYNGGGTLVQNQCMQLIAKRIGFSGNSDFKMGSTCGSAGMSGYTGGGWLVRLVA